MARNTRIFPKSNQEMKRLKIVTLYKSKVSRDLILRQVKVHKGSFVKRLPTKTLNLTNSIFKNFTIGLSPCDMIIIIWDGSITRMIIFFVWINILANCKYGLLLVFFVKLICLSSSQFYSVFIHSTYSAHSLTVSLWIGIGSRQ